MKNTDLKRRSFLGTLFALPFTLSWLPQSKAAKKTTEKIIEDAVDFDPDMYTKWSDEDGDQKLDAVEIPDPTQAQLKVMDGLPNPEPIPGETLGEYADRKTAMMTQAQKDEMNELHGCPERNRKYIRDTYAIAHNNRLMMRHFQIDLRKIGDLTALQRETMQRTMSKLMQITFKTEFHRVHGNPHLDPVVFGRNNYGKRRRNIAKLYANPNQAVALSPGEEIPTLSFDSDPWSETSDVNCPNADDEVRVRKIKRINTT